jgi:hypothetical protein
MRTVEEVDYMTAEKKYLIVSDGHSGSLYGLMQERCVIRNVLTDESSVVRPNAGQRYLLRRWKDMVHKVGQVDCCVLNGDMCDGVQRKSQGMHLWTTDLNSQVDNMVGLCKMIRAKKFVGTQGSGYHNGDNVPLDQAVVEQLPNGEFHPDFILRPGHDDPAWKDCKFAAHISHDVPTTKSIWMYATTAIARQMVLIKLNDALHKYGKVPLVVRSHQHWLVGSYFSHSHGFITAAWQLRTPFAIKTGIITPPEIGYSLVYVEPSGKFTVDHDGVETPATTLCPVVEA